ncbi:hypothetical protein M378DRAFT_914454 [Amanita muscaria Koide BX008]|uniref:Uncharacterized protein n=1 Tax=Amanita muscaria (strain Koide BX008) TaxID=946122 RepID=A0A0C2WUX4_AMAMK|nr:hypothetical protein M378DRAFT_914454 [Amanita muscaria Koide BX008]
MPTCSNFSLGSDVRWASGYLPRLFQSFNKPISATGISNHNFPWQTLAPSVVEVARFHQSSVGTTWYSNDMTLSVFRNL